MRPRRRRRPPAAALPRLWACDAVAADAGLALLAAAGAATVAALPGGSGRRVLAGASTRSRSRPMAAAR
jgi:hypothetical protein